MKKIKFFNIEYDTDGQEIKLPKELIFDVDLSFDVDMDGAELISNKVGFCVFNFDYIILNKRGKNDSL